MLNLSYRVSLVAGLAVWLATAAGVAGELKFREVVIDDAAADKTCYSVVTADVNGDGRNDIVVVTDNRVQWYEAPDWTKHIIIENQTELDNVCIAPFDIDGDGKVDFGLGAGWTKIGTIQWIRRPTEGHGKWTVHPIGIEQWTHRMRWADVLGEGKPQLVVSPLNATDGPGVKLTAFSIPADPINDRWPSTVLDASLNRMHNHLHLDWNEDGVASTLTASQEGLSLIRRGEGGAFARQRVGSGMTADDPQQSGAGEVRVGRFVDGTPFMATIEPMHGTAVAIYTGPSPLPEGQLAERVVVDDSLQQGHALWCVDLDGDAGDEVIAGHREPGTGVVRGPGVYVYRSSGTAVGKWEKVVIDDGGMACEDLLCEDLTGDGQPDIVAVGRKTRNVKLYVNETR
ncbi:MAG: VCBS repeat-containing protein [Planctomycetaceae bacterium]